MRIVIHIILMINSHQVIMGLLCLWCLYIAPVRALERKSTSKFTVKVILLDKKEVCVAFLIRNNSNKGVYIEKPKPAHRGAATIPLLKMTSPNQTNFPYKRVPDMRRRLEIFDYVYIRAGKVRIDSFCLRDFFVIDQNIEKVWFDSYIPYYELESDTMLYLGSERNISNVLKISGN